MPTEDHDAIGVAFSILNEPVPSNPLEDHNYLALDVIRRAIEDVETPLYFHRHLNTPERARQVMGIANGARAKVRELLAKRGEPIPRWAKHHEEPLTWLR